MHFTRESIFVGAIRTFCTSIAVILGLTIGIGLVVMGVGALSSNNYLPPKAQPRIMPDANGSQTLLPGNTPAILRIDIHGVIGTGDLTGEKIKGILLDSRDDFLKGNRVKAILLHLNTPGGTVTDADAIYRLLLDYKTKYNVPIYSYIDGLCASGGMYIASASEKIFATPSSIIGSVGVIMGPAFNFSEAMTKWGISSLTMTEGKDKDALNPFRAWKPDEDASLKAVIAALYDRFVSIVSSARPKLTRDKLVNDYGAHVFVAAEAETLGYIDVAGSDYSTAVSALVEAGKLGEHYQVVQLLPQHDFLESLTQSIFPHKILQSVGLPAHSELRGQFLYFYQP